MRLAISPDSLTYRSLGPAVLSRASVPDAAPVPNGVRLYYVNGEPGEHGIWRADPDGAGGWQPSGRVLIDGSYQGDAVDPDVVRLPDGRYRLFYFLGHFTSGPPPARAAHPIYSAISDDGVTFKTEQKIFEAPGVTDPSAVLLPDGSWVLALARPASRKSSIVIARGADGREFKKIAELGGGIPELTLAADGSLRLYANEPGGIGSRRSFDGGRTWMREEGLRLKWKGLAADPSAAADQGVQLLFFKTLMPACSEP